jgi:predicted component of type VI protein secretion system
MRYQDGQWWIENLSPEDPLVLNGQRLLEAAPPRALEDGDTVRLGRADFVFRMP